MRLKKVTVFGISLIVALVSLLIIINLPTSSAATCLEDFECNQEAGEICLDGVCYSPNYASVNVSINGRESGTSTYLEGPITLVLGRSINLMWNWSSGDELNFYPQKCTASGDWFGTRSCEGFETITPTTTGMKTYNFTWQDFGRLGTIFDPTVIYYDWFQATVIAQLTVASPNGGENWETNSIQTITWTGPSQTYVPDVKIELSRNNGGSWETLFASTPNDNSQAWTVTDPATTQALIRISDVANPSHNDSSNSVFTISEPCQLTSAYWSITNTTEGNPVNLNVQGNNCGGQEIAFDVLEYDSLSADDPVQLNPSNAFFSESFATGTWTAEWQPEGLGESDPPEYYFKATALVSGSQISSGTGGSELLTVYQTTEDPCLYVAVCGDYIDDSSCRDDACTVASNSVPAGVDCNDPDTTCYCAWETGSSSCLGAYDVNDPEDPSSSGVGTCFYDYDSTDTCDDDGFLTLTWITTWQWDPTCDATCQSNPDNQALRNQCLADNGQQDTVACPANIPLPFFNIYNIIAAVVLISLVYWAISMRKKKTGKRKR
jgi:hypothetical protein